MMMEVWCLSSLLCPRVFYYDYKTMRQQRKRDKENLQVSRYSKANMIRQHFSQSLGNSSNPTLEIFFHTIGGSRASCWAVEEDGDLELSCPQVHCSYQTSLLLLFITSLPLSLYLLYHSTLLRSSFLLLWLWYDSMFVKGPLTHNSGACIGLSE